jgi:SAM-dependent methyltransferase
MPEGPGHLSPLPLDRAAFGGRESHQAREIAESFGTDPGRYDRARPSYPAAMVDQIVAASPGPEVLDVGCGTGIVARQFQAAGCQVLGVDADVRMADLARQRGLDVEVARFEDWEPGTRRFDLVTAGQAWHWVDPVSGAAKAAQVLRPGGRLAVFWNAFQPPDELGEAFAAVFARVMPDWPVRMAAPRLDSYSLISGKAADGMRQAGAFGEPRQWRYGWDRPYSRAEWLDQIPTSGFATQLPPATLRELIDGIGAAIDAAGGGFLMRYATVVVTASRTSAG